MLIKLLSKIWLICVGLFLTGLGGWLFYQIYLNDHPHFWIAISALIAIIITIFAAHKAFEDKEAN